LLVDQARKRDVHRCQSKLGVHEEKNQI
jgi:hypothetical protein